MTGAAMEKDKEPFRYEVYFWLYVLALPILVPFVFVPLALIESVRETIDDIKNDRT